MFSVFFTLIRKELLEHKVGLIFAPWIVACILACIIILVYLGITEIGEGEAVFSTTRYEDEDLVNGIREASEKQKTDLIRTALLLVGMPVLLVAGLAALAYSLTTFSDERKDKSVIFWRSLPVSDLTTIFSKLAVVVFCVPLIIVPSIIFLQIISLLSASTFFHFNEIVPFGYLWGFYLAIDWFRIIFSLWAQALWTLPILTWLMFTGSYAKKPIIAALVPIFAIVVLEEVILGTDRFYSTIFERLGPWSRSESLRNIFPEISVVDISDIYLLIISSEFWLGLLVSAFLIILTVKIRSRINYSSVD